MHRYMTRACVATAAGLALSAVGVTGASASTAALRAPQAVRVPSARAPQAPANPGAQLWAKSYGDGTAYSVAVNPTGKMVFVTGQSYGSSTAGVDYATVAYHGCCQAPGTDAPGDSCPHAATRRTT